MASVWKYAGKLKKYLPLVLLPLVCGGVLLAVVWNITNRQMNQYGELTARYFASEAAAMFDEAERACTYLTQDELFWDCMHASSPWSFDQGLLCANIRKYTAPSSYISDIFVCHSGQGMVYSSQAYWAYAPYSAIISSAELSAILREPVQTGWHVLNADDDVPYYIDRFPLEDGQDVYLIVTLEMYPLLQFMHSIDAQGCALFNEEGFITPLITSRTDIDWSDEHQVRRLLHARVKCFYRTGNDYTYMVAVDQRDYDTPLRLIGLFFGLYFAVVAAAGFLYVYAAAARDRKRFSAILDYLPPEYPSGSDDELFANIRSSLRQYQTDKKKFEDENRSSAVRQILKRGQSKAVHDSRYQMAGIPLDAPAYCVVSLSADDYSDMFFDDGDELQNIDFARIIFRTALDEIAAGRVGISGAGLGRIYASVFSFPGSEDPRRLTESVVREMVDFIEKNYGLNLCAVLSDPVQDPRQICAAYQETERLREYVRVLGIESGIISTQNLTDMTEDPGDYITQLQILTNAVQAEQFDVAPHLVEQVLSQYVTNQRRQYHIVQSRVDTMSGLLSEAVLACRIPDTGLLELSGRFRDAHTVASVLAAAREVFPLLQQSAEARAADDPVKRACAYIKEHSADPSLSIPTISEASGVSPRHLGRLFQKKLGCTVAAYLHSHRIACSKKILAETTLPISAVAQRVGYNSTNTFVYNFRHCEGITPTGYREKVRN